MISHEVEPPHCIQQEARDTAWKDGVFRIAKKVIPIEQEMMEERVWQGLFELAWSPYRDGHF